MTLDKSNFDPEKYEENTVRLKDSICPLIGEACPKDPKLCGRYQPFNIVEMKLNVPQTRTVHMCVDDALRLTAETILSFLKALVQPPSGGFKGGLGGFGS